MIARARSCSSCSRGWEALVRAGGVDALLLPAPTQVAQALWDDRSLLAPDLARRRPARSSLGLLAARRGRRRRSRVAMHLSPAVRARAAAARDRLAGGADPGDRAAARSSCSASGSAPKVLIVALVCFFPVTINLYDGLRDADPDARKLLRSLDATRWQALRLLEAPRALPAAFTGMKVAAAVAVIGAVFAEWAGLGRGLGHAAAAPPTASSRPRARSPRPAPARRWPSRSTALRALLERRVVGWTPTDQRP